MRASDIEKARAEAMARIFAPDAVKRERLARLLVDMLTRDKQAALAKLMKVGR